MGFIVLSLGCASPKGQLTPATNALIKTGAERMGTVLEAVEREARLFYRTDAEEARDDHLKRRLLSLRSRQAVERWLGDLRSGYAGPATVVFDETKLLRIQIRIVMADAGFFEAGHITTLQFSESGEILKVFSGIAGQFTAPD